MINLGKTTKASPEQVIKSAVNFFGPGGVGLEIALREECVVHFVGGGGDVRVAACVKEEEKNTRKPLQGGATDVNIQSREWEKQAQDFLSHI